MNIDFTAKIKLKTSLPIEKNSLPEEQLNYYIEDFSEIVFNTCLPEKEEDDGKEDESEEHDNDKDDDDDNKQDRSEVWVGS